MPRIRARRERIARVLLLPDAPSIDANEITDKGYINQRLALERRAADVARLFAARAGRGGDRDLDELSRELLHPRRRRSACTSTSSASHGFGM